MNTTRRDADSPKLRHWILTPIALFALIYVVPVIAEAVVR